MLTSKWLAVNTKVMKLGVSLARNEPESLGVGDTVKSL